MKCVSIPSRGSALPLQPASKSPCSAAAFLAFHPLERGHERKGIKGKMQFCPHTSDGGVRLIVPSGKCPHADPPLFRATFFADQPPSTHVCGQIRANKYRTVSRAFYGIYYRSNCKECNPILLYHFIHSGLILLSRYLYCYCAI
jgi:hypothetical protein